MVRENASNYSSSLGLRGQDCIYQRDACGCQIFSYLFPFCTQRGLCVQHGHCLHISPVIKLLTAWDMKHLPDSVEWAAMTDELIDPSSCTFQSQLLGKTTRHNIRGKVLQGGKRGETGGSINQRQSDGGLRGKKKFGFQTSRWRFGDEQLFHPRCSAPSSNPSSPVTAPFILCLLW